MLSCFLLKSSGIFRGTEGVLITKNQLSFLLFVFETTLCALRELKLAATFLYDGRCGD